MIISYKIKETGQTVPFDDKTVTTSFIDKLISNVNWATNDRVELSDNGEDWIQFKSLKGDQIYTLELQ